MHKKITQLPFAPRFQAPQACLGCADCTGICRAVLELASVPDAVLNRAKGSQ